MATFQRIASFTTGTPTAPNISLIKTLRDDSTVAYLSHALPITTIELNKCTHVAVSVTSLGQGSTKAGYTEVIACLIADYNSTSKTMSNLIRGLKADSGTISSDTSLVGSHPSGSRVDCPITNQSLTQIAECLQGERNISPKFGASPTWDTTQSNVALSMPVYADASTGQTAITSPVNGYKFYATNEGVVYKYEGGAWTTEGSGATSNASESVAGKVELATLEEQGAHTETGGTGAILVLQSKNTAKTSAGAGDENKVPVLNSSGKLDSGFENSEVSDYAYGSGWNGVTNQAPSKNVIFDTFSRTKKSFTALENIDGSSTPIPVCIIAPTSTSAVIDYISGGASDTGTIGGGGGLQYGAGQDFIVPDFITKITQLKVSLRRSADTTGSMTLKIRRGDANSATILHSEVINVNSLGTSYSDFTITPSSDIDVIPGEQLSITIVGDGNTGSYSYWEGNGASFYSEGQRWYDNDTGTFISTTGDLNFQVSGYIPSAGIAKSDANVTVRQHCIGFLDSNVLMTESGVVTMAGIIGGFSSLSVGAKYYVQDAVGTIGTSAGTTTIVVGRAISATEIQILLLQ